MIDRYCFVYIFKGIKDIKFFFKSYYWRSFVFMMLFFIKCLLFSNFFVFIWFCYFECFGIFEKEKFIFLKMIF